jgi:hypothetical protein
MLILSLVEKGPSTAFSWLVAQLQLNNPPVFYPVSIDADCCKLNSHVFIAGYTSHSGSWFGTFFIFPYWEFHNPN